MNQAETIKTAAHVLPQLHNAPVEALIDNTIEELIADCDPEQLNHAVIGLVRAALLRGIELANTRIGDLM